MNNYICVCACVYTFILKHFISVQREYSKKYKLFLRSHTCQARHVDMLMPRRHVTLTVYFAGAGDFP